MLNRISAIVAVAAVAIAFACGHPVAAATEYVPIAVSAVSPTDSGLNITSGQTVTGRAAGYANAKFYANGFGPVSTPDGIASLSAPGGTSYPAPQCRPLTLIGSIGGASGSWFCLGSTINFVAQSSGELYFWYNDRPVGDNHGGFSVILAAPTGP